MRKRVTVLALLVTGILAYVGLATGAPSKTDRSQAVAASTVNLTGWSVGTTEEELLKQVIPSEATTRRP
jgi:hypothetical protein